MEKCFSQLKISKMTSEDPSLINIKSTDKLIGLSPCIGIYQEAVFFDNYQIEEAIKLKLLLNPELNGLYTTEVRESSLDQKILFLVSLETKQRRYRSQVDAPFVSGEQSKRIMTRLETRLDREEDAQVECQIHFYDPVNGERKFSVKGFADVVKDGIVYELKFVSELIHEHYLQCALYMVAMNLRKEILWNTRDNTLYGIEVPDRKAFLDVVTKTITKGLIEKYYNPDILAEEKNMDSRDIFAVIDTETNWNDEVMSIGIVFADSWTMKKMDSMYYIIDPEYRIGGMYSDELRFDKKGVHIAGRKQALKEIKQWLDRYYVHKIFAYNASFDKKHLPECAAYEWYDIMRLAAYRQYNRAIPASAECCKTGKLKSGYGVENILKMLSRNRRYNETHNAVLDAEDELKIMQLLRHKISEYDIARIQDKKIPDKGLQKRKMNSSEEKVNRVKKKKGVFSKISDKLLFGRG